MANHLHRWLAWLFAFPLIWLSLTGALLGFSDEMDRIVHVELMTTPMSQQPTLPESVQHDRIRQAFPSYQWVAFTPAKNPVDTSVALLKDEHDQLWQVFLNPKLGEVNGIRALSEDWSEILMDWHRFAFLGDQLGSLVAIFSTTALLLILLTGWMRSKEQTQKRYSLHRLLGQWLTPILLVILLSALAFLLQNSGWFASSIDWLSIHQGQWLGMPGRLLWVLVSICLLWLIIAGLWLVSTHKKDY